MSDIVFNLIDGPHEKDVIFYEAGEYSRPIMIIHLKDFMERLRELGLRPD